MLTYNAYILLFINELSTIYPIKQAQNMAYWTLESVCGFSKIQIQTNKNNLIDAEKTQKLINIIQELKLHTPIQYVLGSTLFYELLIKVNKSVLIPRPETEELVYFALTDIKNNNLHSPQLTIIDIGTGSGCIALALKNKLPLANITAIDVSEEALLVAKQNAQNLNLSVNFIHIDIQNPLNWHKLPNYQVIISNPPYICPSEKIQMQPNVVNFEPHLALFTPTKQPLYFYHLIANFAAHKLLPMGYIYLEINENFAQQTLKLFINNGLNAELIKDMQQKDRIIKAYKPL